VPWRRATAVLAVLAVGLALPDGAPAAKHQKPLIPGGTIVVGHGIAGATLGMSRATLLKALAVKPTQDDFPGLSWYRDTNDPYADAIFNVDLSRRNRRVRLIEASGYVGDQMTLTDGNPVFRTGGIVRLYERFGSRVHPFVESEPDVDLRGYIIRSRLLGRPVETLFATQTTRSRAKAVVYDVYVLFSDEGS
jgi:hypothetical protein